MPIIKEYFNETVEDYTTTAKINIPTTKQSYPQTSVDTTVSVNSITGISDNFFKNLKSCLEQTSLSITFDDTEYSFTVFGVKFYCICYNTCTTANKTYYSVIPAIFRYGQYSSYGLGQNPFTYTYSNSNTTYFGHDRNATIVDYQDGNLQYQINIHYNTNFLHITYGSKLNISNTYPLCCLIECETVGGDKCVYTSLDCNAYGANGNLAMENNCHQIVLVDKPYLSYPSTNNTNIYGDGMFTKVNHLDYTQMSEFFDTSKIVKMQPICMQGILKFGENIIAGPFDMGTGYYEIDDEIYFCPGSTLYESVTQTYSSYLSSCQKLLLKI